MMHQDDTPNKDNIISNVKSCASNWDRGIFSKEELLQCVYQSISELELYVFERRIAIP